MMVVPPESNCNVYKKGKISSSYMYEKSLKICLACVIPKNCDLSVLRSGLGILLRFVVLTSQRQPKNTYPFSDELFYNASNVQFTSVWEVLYIWIHKIYYHSETKHRIVPHVLQTKGTKI